MTQEYWETAVEWMDLLEGSAVGNILENALRGFTDTPYLNKNETCTGMETKLMGTAFMFQQAQLMARLATALGDTAAASHYHSLANATYAAFNAKFFSSETGT